MGGEIKLETQKNDNRMLWIVLGVAALCVCLAAFAVVAVAGAFIYLNSGAASTGLVGFASPATESAFPDSGDEVGVTMDIPDLGTDHVDTGSYVNYNSNPPTSGPHYGQSLSAGFYEDVVEDGHIVHSMEHGYVVIWYNCDGVNNQACDDLKSQIETIITDHNTYKLIGMDRTGGMDHLIALTSWGKLAYLDKFDEAFINDFIDANQNKSPEPGGS